MVAKGGAMVILGPDIVFLSEAIVALPRNGTVILVKCSAKGHDCPVMEFMGAATVILNCCGFRSLVTIGGLRSFIAAIITVLTIITLAELSTTHKCCTQNHD